MDLAKKEEVTQNESLLGRSESQDPYLSQTADSPWSLNLQAEVNPYEKNRNVYTRGRNLAIIGCAANLVISTIISIFVENSIFNNSLGFQEWIQDSFDSDSMRFIMNVISNLVHPQFVVAALILIFAFSRHKFEILNFLLYFGFVSYVTSILKTLFASPRPYWVSSQIKEWEWVCYQEYGNPSGHSLLGPLFYEFLLINYALRKINKNNKIAKLCAKIGTIVLIFLILFCRLYLGMHSINQVLYGLVIGLSLIVLYRLYFRVTLKRVLLYLVRCNIDNKSRNKSCIFILGIFALSIIIPSTIYGIQESVMNKTQQNQWAIQIEKKCNLESLDQLKAFNGRCFIDCSGVCICFALLLGFLYTKHPEFLLGRYKEQSHLLLRAFVITISSILIIGVFMLLPADDIVILKFTFQSIGIFGAGFSLIYLAPILLIKYALIVPAPLHKQLSNDLTKEMEFEEEYMKSSVYSSNSEDDPSFGSAITNSELPTQEKRFQSNL